MITRHRDLLVTRVPNVKGNKTINLRTSPIFIVINHMILSFIIIHEE